MIIETLLLHAADLDSLHAFYGQRLGLPVAWNNRNEHLMVTVGASQLVFQHVPGFAGQYHFAFNIPENRLTAAHAFLETQGISRIVDDQGKTTFDFDAWNAHALYFYDAGGNIVECIARHELPNGLADADNKPFLPTELLNLSEIGLPVNDVPMLAAMLSENVDSGPYRETSTAFMPMGDANGLFILVPEGRVWFPDTGIAAEALPVQAMIQNDIGARFAVQGVPYRIIALDRL